MAWQPPEIRPEDIPVIHDAHTYDVFKQMADSMETGLAEEFGDIPIPGFAQRLITSIRWRLREWEIKQSSR